LTASNSWEIAMTEALLVGGVRTPYGRHRGALAPVRPDDLAAHVLSEVISRASVPADAVDDVVLGATNQAGEDNRNVARMAALLAGLPDHVPGMTVNRLCGSGLSAVIVAAHAVRAGEADVVIAGGVESMTRAPWVVLKSSSPWSEPPETADTTLGWRLVNPRFAQADACFPDGAAPEHRRVTVSLGETAELVADLDGIGRDESDEFALRSHMLGAASAAAGRFAGEIAPITANGVEVTDDECVRPGVTAESLGRLKPVFRPNGVVTAGSASPLSDGASAVIVASEAAVERLGLRPRARIVTSAAVGVSPHLMGLGPVPATERALSRAGLQVNDLEAVELNEAFAPQCIAVIRRLKLDLDIVNSWGGAISLGHPVGSSGGRLVTALLSRLEAVQGRYGMASLCIGVGQGLSMVVERL
jgi:acetyl-CoA acetyltransferase family protein